MKLGFLSPTELRPAQLAQLGPLFSQPFDINNWLKIGLEREVGVEPIPLPPCVYSLPLAALENLLYLSIAEMTRILRKTEYPPLWWAIPNMGPAECAYAHIALQ